jgi:hypothetical protein
VAFSSVKSFRRAIADPALQRRMEKWLNLQMDTISVFVLLKSVERLFVWKSALVFLDADTHALGSTHDAALVIGQLVIGDLVAKSEFVPITRLRCLVFCGALKQRFERSLWQGSGE